MKKKERIIRYGIEAYEKFLDQTRRWKKDNPDTVIAHNAVWTKKLTCEGVNRKGGKYYLKIKTYYQKEIPKAKHVVRSFHQRLYQPFKNIIDPNGLTHIHHEWVAKTANYRGVALVEKDQHSHGYIDVIEILEGKITLMTEKDIREGI